MIHRMEYGFCELLRKLLFRKERPFLCVCRRCDTDGNGYVLSEYSPWNSAEKYVVMTEVDHASRSPSAKRLKLELSETSDINKAIKHDEQRLIHKMTGNHVF